MATAKNPTRSMTSYKGFCQKKAKLLLPNRFDRTARGGNAGKPESPSTVLEEVKIHFFTEDTPVEVQSLTIENGTTGEDCVGYPIHGNASWQAQSSRGRPGGGPQ